MKAARDSRPPDSGGSTDSSKSEAILQASVAAIAARGVRGLRVNSVAADAGVSTGLLYYHFADRQGLLTAAFDYLNRRQRVSRSKGDLPDDSPRTRLERHVVDEFQDDPAVVETSAAWHELRASAVYEESLRPALADAANSFATEIADEVRAAQASGEVDPALDPDRIALVLTILMDGLDGRWLCDELTTDEVRELLRYAVDLCLRKGQTQP